MEENEEEGMRRQEEETLQVSGSILSVAYIWPQHSTTVASLRAAVQNIACVAVCSRVGPTLWPVELNFLLQS